MKERGGGSRGLPSMQQHFSMSLKLHAHSGTGQRKPPKGEAASMYLVAFRRHSLVANTRLTLLLWLDAPPQSKRNCFESDKSNNILRVPTEV